MGWGESPPSRIWMQCGSGGQAAAVDLTPALILGQGQSPSCSSCLTHTHLPPAASTPCLPPTASLPSPCSLPAAYFQVWLCLHSPWSTWKLWSLPYYTAAAMVTSAPGHSCMTGQGPELPCAPCSGGHGAGAGARAMPDSKRHGERRQRLWGSRG